MERAPWDICIFYKLPGSMVLSYLSLCKQITGMKVVMFSLLLLLRYFGSASRMIKSAIYLGKFTCI